MSTPIGDYGLLSDRHSAALISRDGSLDWLCLPRFNSPSLFGALLDDHAGHWSFHPSVDYTVARRYVDRSMVLHTEYRTDRGTVVVTTRSHVGSEDDPHRLGDGAPHLLVRSVSGVDGEVPIEITFSPRPEYGLGTPTLSASDGVLTARGGRDLLMLSTPISLQVNGGSAHGATTVRAGETMPFELHWSELGRSEPRSWSPQLGLPLRLGTRRQSHAAGAVGRGLPG